MAATRKDMADVATLRSNVYGFLAVAFRAEPATEFLARLRSPDFTTVLEALDISLGDDFLAALPEELVEELTVEYTRLFIGPGPHISPHESMNVAYENRKDATLWGPQTVKVKRFIEAAGLAFDESFSGMPDHISAELEFMQRLATREAQAWADRDEELARNILRIEERFIDEHLAGWAPHFCDKVIEMSEHPFYAGFAEILREFLDYERRRPPASSAETDLSNITRVDPDPKRVHGEA